MGADDGQERKSWDCIRGRLPLAAPKLPNNQLVCGRERPQVVNLTCFSVVIVVDSRREGRRPSVRHKWNQLLISLLGAGVK